MVNKKFLDSFNVVKPNNNGSGSTAQFGYNSNNRCFFLTLANQKSDTKVENARFDYDNKIVYKLSDIELGDFLLLFRKVVKSINGDKGIFHTLESGVSKSLKCSVNDPKYGTGFFLQGTEKNPSGDSSVGVRIDQNESMVIMVMMEEAIRLMYNWGNQDNEYGEK